MTLRVHRPHGSYPMKQCRYAGCRKLTTRTYCRDHRTAKHYEQNHTPHKTELRRWYKNPRWVKLRETFLNGTTKLCRICQEHGRTVPATQVDHITPREERPDLEYDESNLQPLCDRCHGRKTMEEQRNRGLVRPAPSREI